MWPFSKKKPSTSTPAQVVSDPFLGDATARRLREALTARDWGVARDLLSAPMSNDDRAFFIEISAGTEGIQDWIEGPIRDEPQSTLPLLVRGTHAVYWAWEARGTGMGETVGEDQWKVWFRRLKLAEDCLDEVTERDPKNVEAWHFLTILGRARQLPKDERWRRFNRVLELDPFHHYGHDQMLQNLCQKWSGSHEEMFAFARSRAAAAPGTALPALIATAHMEFRFDNGGHEYMERQDVGEEIVAAALQSIWHPAYRRTPATPHLWNRFAMAFSLCDRFQEAERCFQLIGDNLHTEGTWDVAYFVKLRNYVRGNL